MVALVVVLLLDRFGVVGTEVDYPENEGEEDNILTLFLGNFFFICCKRGV